jgi:hypothetical protein
MSTTSQQTTHKSRNVPHGRKTSRRMPPRECPIAEDRPPTHKMWRDRRGNALIFALRSYEGRAYGDVRIYYTNSSGVLAPSPKGITFALNKLPEVAKALSKMCAEARELGLLKSEADE